MLWWGFVLAAALNGVLALQMALYWKEKEGKDRKERLTTGERIGLEKVEVASGVEKNSLPVKVAPGPSSRPTSPPATGKRYVRKLD